MMHAGFFFEISREPGYFFPQRATATCSWQILLLCYLIQNAASGLDFNLHKFSHTTLLRCSLHWLPVAVRIRCITLMHTCKAKNGLLPAYPQELQINLATESLSFSPFESLSWLILTRQPSRHKSWCPGGRMNSPWLLK